MRHTRLWECLHTVLASYQAELLLSSVSSHNYAILYAGVLGLDQFLGTLLIAMDHYYLQTATLLPISSTVLARSPISHINDFRHWDQHLNLILSHDQFFIKPLDTI